MGTRPLGLEQTAEDTFVIADVGHLDLHAVWERWCFRDPDTLLDLGVLLAKKALRVLHLGEGILKIEALGFSHGRLPGKDEDGTELVAFIT